MTGELGDARSLKATIRARTAQQAREQTETAIHDAVRFANRALRQVGNSPPPDASMDEWAMESIADSVVVEWRGPGPSDPFAEGSEMVATWEHPHTDKIELGVQPHMIEGDPWLYFPWYNMPDEVREIWEPRWEDPDNDLSEPYVFYTEISHPGIPAVGFVRGGFTRAVRKHGLA